MHKFTSPKRTDGDGMEHVTDNVGKDTTDELKKEKLRDSLIYHPSDFKEFSSQPPVIADKKVYLVPKHITPKRKDVGLIFNSREPKFVPYEPYKAAVNPIVPYEKSRKPGKKSLIVKQVIPTEKKSVNVQSGKNKDASDDKVNGFKALEEEARRLREENTQLESQLNFQAQVNGELKNLLVAAVGEDLQARVQFLTEDKLHLANALLKSANSLSTHQEQTEWLAGQCEVWRSKFLASSLMVEDLARWKAALCQKSTELQGCIKRLLEERNIVREHLIQAHRDLTVMRASFDVTWHPDTLPSSSIIDLAGVCQQLSASLRLQLLGTQIRSTANIQEPNVSLLESRTKEERNAEQLLMHPLPLLAHLDTTYSALIGATLALGNNQLFPPTAPSCCMHCSGKVQQV